MIEDIRVPLIKERLKKIEKVLIICSGKGGVGKSTLSAGIAYLLSLDGYNVGILDLDLHGPSILRILGYNVSNLELRIAKEGIEPIQFEGIKIASLSIFVEDRGIPLRGDYKSKVILDLLAYFNWNKLDFLIIDMPPGTGDELILTTRFTKDKCYAILIGVGDELCLTTLSRLVQIIKDLGVKILGIVHNMYYMVINNQKIPLFNQINLAKSLNLELLGELPFDNCLSYCISRSENPFKKCENIVSSLKVIKNRIIEKILRSR